MNELLKNGDLKLRSEVEADEKRHKWEEFLGILKDAVKDRKSPDQTKRKPHLHNYDDDKLDMIIEALDSLKSDDDDEIRTKPTQRKPKTVDSEEEERDEVQPKPDDGEDSEEGSDKPMPDSEDESEEEQQKPIKGRPKSNKRKPKPVDSERDESEEEQQKPIKRRPKPTQRKPKPVDSEEEDSEEEQPKPDDKDGEDSEEGIDKSIPDEIEKEDSEEEQQKPTERTPKPHSDNDNEKFDLILQLLEKLKNVNTDKDNSEEVRPKPDDNDGEDSEEEPDNSKADDTETEESEEVPQKPIKRRPKPNKRRPKPDHIDREDSEEEPDKPKTDDTDKEKSEEEPEKPMKPIPKPDSHSYNDDKLDLILQLLEKLKNRDQNDEVESTKELPEKSLPEDSDEEPDKPKYDDTEKEESDQDSKEPDSSEEDSNEPTTSDEGDDDNDEEGSECTDDLDEEQLLQGVAFVQNQLKRFLGIECTCNPTKQTVLNECLLHKKSSARHRREDHKESVRASGEPEKQIIKNKKFTKKATQNDIKKHTKKYTQKTDSSTASSISKVKVIEGSDKLPLTNAEIQANILKLLKNVGISTHIVQKPTSKLSTTASQSPADTNNDDLQFFRNKSSVHRPSTDSKSSDKKNRRKLRNRRKGRKGSPSRTVSPTTAKRTQREITSEEIAAKQEEGAYLRNYKTEDSTEEILLSRPVDKSDADIVDHEIEDLKSLYIKYKKHADEVKRKENVPTVSAEPAEKETEISDSEEKILKQHSIDHVIDYSYSPEVDDSTSDTEYEIAESDSNYHNLFKKFSKMIDDEKDSEIHSTADADKE